MNLSTQRELPRATPESSVACLVEMGPLRFKVWHKSPIYLCLLTDEDPSILQEFRVGKMLTMEYRDVDLKQPSERLTTTVRKIKRNKGGKLKGQYLVDLEILKSYH